MKLILHYPDTEEKQKELARRVALLHAQAVIDYVNGLSYTLEEKINLIQQIQESST